MAHSTYLIIINLVAAATNTLSWTAQPMILSRKIQSTTKLRMATSAGRPLSCRPIGIGSAAPKTVVTNVDLESIMDTTDEWIQTRTGIAQRRLLLSPIESVFDEEQESLSSLQITAAKAAIEMSGVDPKDIDLVICATSSPDNLFGDAPFVSNVCGCTNAFAFDLTAACSGFLFGMVTAGQFMNNNKKSGVQKCLVIGADALSRWVDWDDRNSCILFGDGAGAMVLESCSSEEGGILGYSAHSNGAGMSDLACGYKGIPQTLSIPQNGESELILSSGSYDFITMEGKEVYKFATREVPRVLQESLDAAEMSVDDIDWLLLHQANIRIMETVAKRLKIPMEKVLTNLKDYGNTSAGSIPLALDEAVRSEQVKKGDIIAVAGFGAGLSWGGCILKWG